MKIGVIGGGQLCLMMAQEIKKKNLPHKIIALDPTTNCPAKPFIFKQIVGDFKDEKKILKLASLVDVLTFEIELANSSVLKKIKESGKSVAPNPDALYIIQDKFRQKTFLKKKKILVPDFIPIKSKKDLIKGLETFGFPSLLKATQNSYDGRGNYLIKSKKEIDEGLKLFKDSPLMLEKFLDFEKEISVVAVRSFLGEIKTYPLCENIHKDNILNITICPAKNISNLVMEKAVNIAKKIMEIFDVVGVFVIEFFITKDFKVLVNEIAPRVHNSGHHTIESSQTSQFEQHIKAITNMKIGTTNLTSKAIMFNILGDFEGEFEVIKKGLPKNAFLHMYGKKYSKPKRKLGHITILTDDFKKGEAIKNIVKIVPKVLKKNENLCKEKAIEIRVGSYSDISKIENIFIFLNKMKIGFSLRILSAHRTPNSVTKEAQLLEKNNFKVSIGCAGGSAHLAGMTASLTTIPVVALPVKSSLGGLDSLLSIIQMPSGVPNGCVGISDWKSATILSLRIAYLNDEKIRERLSKELNTKIISKFKNKPFVNIITDNPNLDTKLLDKFGIGYSINSKIESPIVLYVFDILKLAKILPKNLEQISIIVPTKNKNFKLKDLENIVVGPYAWMGVGILNNGIIYAAQILGNYFSSVKKKFKEYRKDLSNQVEMKDKEIQEKNYSNK